MVHTQVLLVCLSWRRPWVEARQSNLKPLLNLVRNRSFYPKWPCSTRFCYTQEHIMVSAEQADSPSRLRVSLKAADGQKFDQIIALTQANINQSLSYHFNYRQKELLKFDAKVLSKMLRMQLVGTIQPPKIQLIDAPGADKALYVLTFNKGSKYIPMVPLKEGEEADTWYDASGWKIAFEVSFGLQELLDVPADIMAAINKPGSYSVSQLIIIFSKAETLKFHWSASHINLENKEDLADVESMLPTFIGRWLTSARMNEDPDKHNVLGYAVTTKQPRLVEPAAPNFPPNSVRLQTIAHRPNGDANATSTESDYNAFLFTEMCGTNAMIAADLNWSGELFYRAIGGTLVMNKSLFWDDYIRKLLAPVNESTKSVINTVGRDVTDSKSKLGEWVISDSSSDLNSNELSISGNDLTYTYSRKKDHRYEEGPCTCRPSFDTNMTGTVKPISKNAFSYDRTWSMVAVNDVGIDTPFFKAVSGKSTITVNCQSVTVFHMESVESSGKLNIRAENRADVVTTDVKLEADGMLIDIAKRLNVGSAIDAFIGKMDKGEAKRIVDNALQAVLPKIITMSQDMTKVFSAQSNFVLPGGGTFDMKDPLFTDEGDLMCGLVYRK